MKKIFAAFLFSFLCLALPARAQTLEIAAVVNDEVISRLDVQNRLSLIALSTDIALTPENTQKLYPQILRNLIDEKLQLQEARRLGLSASDTEVNAAITRLAAQNNLPPEQFEQFISQKGASFDSLLDQVRATIVWTKIIRQKFSTAAIVTEDEIQEAINREKTNLTAPQYLVAEIFLNVETPGDEASVKELADRLVSEVMQGAPFAPLARQFSQSASAPQGGDLGWVKRGQLPALLDQKLALMQPNQITKPQRLADGYVIMLLRDVRIPEEGSVPDINRQAVADLIRQKKLEGSARKYLRDLRTLALVDLRS